MEGGHIKVLSVVEAWLDNVAYSHSESASTRDNYSRDLKDFCTFINASPETILKEYEATTDRVFRRRYAQLLRSWISKLSNRGYAKNSVSCKVSAVKSFFKYNDLPLAYVPVAKTQITFHNRDLAKKELVMVIKSSSTRERAFYSVMSQSGLRPGTLSRLRLRHVEPELSKGIVPCKVEVPAELSKGEFGAYFSFIGEEAIDRLKAYLATRPRLDPEDFLFVNHGSDKHLNRKSVTNIFSDTVQKLRGKGLLKFKDNRPGKPRELRLYCLRKWFRNQAAQAGVEYVNFWMGHKANYKAPHIPKSDEHYFSREDVEFQRGVYREKAMPFLRLDEPTPTETERTITELRKDLAEKEKMLNILKPLIEFAQSNPNALENFLSVLTVGELELLKKFKKKGVEEQNE